MTAGLDQPRVVQKVGVRLIGTGMALPPRVMTNEDLAKLVDTDDQWITKRTGIKTRHIVENGQTTLDLGKQAVQQALTNAHIAPTELDLLICATMTAEMCMPSTAARLVAEVGAAPAGAFDVSAACSGFVYALNLAACTIETGQAKTVAVVGVETLSRITDYTDRGTCILFGDGAGAAVFTASDDVNQGALYQKMHSDGRAWADLYCPRTPQDLPSDVNGFSGNFNTMQMNGREVFKFAVTTMESVIDDALQANGLKPADLAMIIPHQSNARILRTARDRLGLPPEKMWININQYGNTSAASVPICLHELVSAGKLHPGDLVLFVAMGGGLTWAACLWRL